MTKGRSRMAAALVACLTTGCSTVVAAGTEGQAPAEGVTVLARIDGWREALTRDPDGTADGHLVVVEVAYDDETARAAWADNVPDGLPQRSGAPVESGIYGDLDEVELVDQALVV